MAPHHLPVRNKERKKRPPFSPSLFAGIFLPEMFGTYSKKLMVIVISVFALNSLFLLLYLLSNLQVTTDDRPPPAPEYLLPSSLSNLTQNLRALAKEKIVQRPNLKPWPVLPSFLPWTLNPDLPIRSCEGYFGNGYTRRVDVIGGSSRGWFRCFYSETLRSSVCEGGNLRMVPERVKMSRGGERIGEVIGRKEEEELPEFENGAFEVLGNFDEIRAKLGNKVKGKDAMLVDEIFLEEYVPEGEVMQHTMRQLIGSIRVVGDDEFQCNQWIEEPALLVTRFEYANLFHTVTDWYSAYVASRVTNVTHRPHLIFLDGHCKMSRLQRALAEARRSAPPIEIWVICMRCMQMYLLCHFCVPQGSSVPNTPLEETWKAMFSSLRYAKHFVGPVCFRHAILVPLGYETSLFKGLNEVINCEGTSALYLSQNHDNQKTARLSEFGEMIRASFGFHIHLNSAKKPLGAHNVLFVRREDYLAHPRHGGKVESRLSNEQEVFDSLQKWASNHLECKINLVNGLFAHMSMKEQIRAIQEASVIIGAHGAGLTHTVSATPETVILEIISAFFRRPHFQLIARWKGLNYHAINLNGSHASPPVVVDRLRRIMQGLGC